MTRSDEQRGARREGEGEGEMVSFSMSEDAGGKFKFERPEVCRFASGPLIGCWLQFREIFRLKLGDQ